MEVFALKIAMPRQMRLGVLARFVGPGRRLGLLLLSSGVHFRSDVVRYDAHGKCTRSQFSIRANRLGLSEVDCGLSRRELRSAWFIETLPTVRIV